MYCIGLIIRKWIYNDDYVTLKTLPLLANQILAGISHGYIGLELRNLMSVFIYALFIVFGKNWPLGVLFAKACWTLQVTTCGYIFNLEATESYRSKDWTLNISWLISFIWDKDDIVYIPLSTRQKFFQNFPFYLRLPSRLSKLYVKSRTM